jgi:hypothetical protein
MGPVQPIDVVLTSDRPEALQLDARQVFARPAGSDGRVAPLPPAEAAHRAGGKRLPGAARSGARGAVTGGVFGAMGGAISGAIQGGVGLATAAGTAVGATIGAITGVLGGGAQPDVVGFEDRGLRSTTLRQGFSETGYVYFPAGAYRAIEILLVDESGRTEQIVAPLAPPAESR